MPDFAALQEAGAAPKTINFAGSDDPYNLPEYMARDYGLSEDQCSASPAPTADDLRDQGFSMRQYGDGPQEWTTPATDGTSPVTFAMQDPASMAQKPDDHPSPTVEQGPDGNAKITGQPSAEQQANAMINKASSVIGAGIGAAVKGDFSSVAGLGGAIGDALGIPHAGEAAALAGQVRDMLRPGQMSGMLSNPAALANGLEGVLEALGVPVPPALKAAIQQAKQISDALKASVPPGGGPPGVYAAGDFIARMATSATMHGSPLLPGPGAVNVLALGSPVWRAGMDVHLCPLGPPPHVGGVVPPTQFTVFALGAPVARHTADKVMEAGGGPNMIVTLPEAQRAAAERQKKEEEEKKRRQEQEEKKRKQEAEKRQAEQNAKKQSEDSAEASQPQESNASSDPQGSDKSGEQQKSEKPKSIWESWEQNTIDGEADPERKKAFQYVYDKKWSGEPLTPDEQKVYDYVHSKTDADVSGEVEHPLIDPIDLVAGGLAGMAEKGIAEGIGKATAGTIESATEKAVTSATADEIAAVAAKAGTTEAEEAAASAVTKAPIRTEPESLAEQIVMEDAKNGGGSPIMTNEIKDPNYQSPWVKMQTSQRNAEGESITVHYWKNTDTGQMEGFKFKTPPR